MHFSDLTESSIDVLHSAFLDVYGDYKIKLNVSRDQFVSFLDRSCYSPEISLGAFEGNHLVGFQLIGEKIKNGQMNCYNAAAGIIPEYRARSRLAYNHTKCLLSKLRKRRVNIYVYEILVDNKNAIKIMHKFGAKIRRQIFNCRKDVKTIINNSISHKGYFLKKEDNLSFLSNFEYSDEMSSWQNSIYAIKRIFQEFSVITIRKDNKKCGFGIIHKLGGDIPQFYIDEEHRGKGIGSVLLSTLANSTLSKYVYFQNVDEKNKLLCRFLNKLQFQTLTRSYEMVNYF